MHLFRSILNAHFLRYVTLVIVACFSFINIQSSVHAAVVSSTASIENSASATFSDGSSISSNSVSTDVNTSKDIDTTFIKLLNFIISAISFLYVPFSMLSSWLLSPDWTFGDFIHLRPILHSLWIFVSNTVYVVFAAMLIIVAIANIFGQSDSYAIKKMLPRFIIGVIMVPFTWWIVSATLSISSYMTALVLRMPADMITSSSSNEYNVNVPKACTLDFTINANVEILKCGKSEPQPISQFLKSNNAYGIIPLYAYNIFKFDDLNTFKGAIDNVSNLTPEQQNAILAANENKQSFLLQASLIATGIAKIGVQLFMSALFALVFMIILIALVVVLFIRVIKMWIYAIFSPLFALRYFLSDKIDKDNAIAKFDFREFIGLAMVPVVVSGALSFGFLFLMTFKTHMEQPPKSETNGISAQRGIDSQFLTVKDGANASSGTITFFGIDINITLPESSTKSTNGNNADNLSVALLNVLSGLVTPILGVIILWMAVMAAMKTSTVAGEAVKGIEGFGDQIAGMAKKLPGFLPVPGMTVKGADGKEKAMSFKHMDGLLKSFQAIPGQLETAAYNDVQRTWFNKNPFEDITSKINGANPKDAIRMFMEEMNKSKTSFNTVKDTPAAKQAMVALTNKISDSEKKAAFDAKVSAGEFKEAIIEALKNGAFDGIGRRPDIATKLSTLGGASTEFEEIVTLLGGFKITVNSFDGIDTLSASNRKFKLKKEFTADQQEKDLEIPAASNIDEIKTYLKSHIPNIVDSDLQAIADKIHQKLHPTP